MTPNLKSKVLNSYKQKYLNLLHEILSLEPTNPHDIMKLQDFVRFDLQELGE